MSVLGAEANWIDSSADEEALSGFSSSVST